MKLVLAVVLLGCAAYVSADCSVLEAFKVKHQWKEAYGPGNERLKFGIHVWQRFFHDHPDARSLFKRVHGDNIFSTQFQAHIERLLGGLDRVISLLDEPDILKAELAHLHGQHAERSINADYFGHLRDALLETLAEHHETNLDQTAWVDCLNHIADGIK